MLYDDDELVIRQKHDTILINYNYKDIPFKRTQPHLQGTKLMYQ